MSLKSFKRRLVTLATSTGLLSCGAADGGWQALTLPKLGELRLRHSHVLTASDRKNAEATAQTLLQWTRDNAWDRLRVKVNASHPLVTGLKAGPVLVLTPEDAALPVIWLSLEPGNLRALLEDRGSGALAACDPPPGKTLALRWLGL